MDTNELIKALAADTRPSAASLSSVWWGAAGLAIALAAAVFFAMLGPRPDIAAAAETPRFLFKFVVTVTLAVSAFGIAREDAEVRLERTGNRLALALVTLGLYVAASLLMQHSIGPRLVGDLPLLAALGYGLALWFTFRLAAGITRSGRL